MRPFKSTLLGICLLASTLINSAALAEISEKDFAAALEKFAQTDKGRELIGSTVEKYFQGRQADAAKKREEQMAAEMETQFKNPVTIDVGASPTKGDKDAKVTIIEFSDFQCPFCKRGADTVDAILKKYPKDVKVAFKNLPLPMHPEAGPSAKAALAAGKQGKFWEFHDALFNNQQKLNAAFYEEQAKTLGLDIEKFKKDMASEEIAKQVKEDEELAKKHGISGTPGFFVNGVAVKGAYPVEHFSRIIDRWLTGAPAAEAKKG